MKLYIIGTKAGSTGAVHVIGVRTTEEQAQRCVNAYGHACQVQEWQHGGDAPERVYVARPARR